MGRTRSVGRSVDPSVGRLIRRSVGRSVDARGPVDHDSVGLAQARPNYLLQTTFECLFSYY